jgi:hypothetical protein
MLTLSKVPAASAFEIFSCPEAADISTLFLTSAIMSGVMG